MVLVGGWFIASHSVVLQLFLVKPQSLEAATYFIGVFNMDFYAHQPYNYKLLVSRLSVSGDTQSKRFMTCLRCPHAASPIQAPLLALHAAALTDITFDRYLDRSRHPAASG